MTPASPSCDFTIRPPRPAEADGIVALYDACRSVETDMPRVTAASWARDMALPQFGCGRDFLVAVADDVLIGSAESSIRDQGERRYRHLRLLVHPARRRSGLGTMLLRAVLDQGPREHDLRLGGLVPSGWLAGLAFAHRLGFAEIEREAKMRCTELRPVPDAPSEVDIAQAQGSGAIATRIAVIHDDAFADDVGFTPLAVSGAGAHLAGMDLWTASIAGETVGYALIEPDDHGGMLETLAIVPEQRSRGIGAALAYRALASLNIGNGRTADLGVSSANPGARRIYERLGFTLRHDVTRYATTRCDLLARMGS